MELLDRYSPQQEGRESLGGIKIEVSPDGPGGQRCWDRGKVKYRGMSRGGRESMKTEVSPDAPTGQRC